MVCRPQVLADAALDTSGGERNFVCQLAMSYVEQKYKCKLDGQYKLPRLKYKGDAAAPDPQWIRDTSKEAKIEEVAPGGGAASQPKKKAPAPPKKPPPPCRAFFWPLPPPAADAEGALLFDGAALAAAAAAAATRVEFDEKIGAAHDGAVARRAGFPRGRDATAAAASAAEAAAAPPLADSDAPPPAFGEVGLARADRPAVLEYEIDEVGSVASVACRDDGARRVRVPLLRRYKSRDDGAYGYIAPPFHNDE